MANRDIVFTVDANVQPAQVKLDDVQQSFEDAAGAAKTFDDAVGKTEQRTKKLATAVDVVDKRIEAITKDMDALSAAIRRGEGPVEAYREELRRLQMQLEAASGASRSAGAGLEGLGAAANGARGGGGFGMGVLQLSQTLDDLQYGIRGVVNNVPGLVQGFGMGAGVAGAAQLSMIAVSQLTDKLTAYIKKQQEATQVAIKFRLTMQDMTLSTLERTKALEDDLQRIQAVAVGGESAGRALDLNRKLTDETIRRQNAQAEIDRLLALGESRVTKTMPGAVQNLTKGERDRLEAMKQTLRQSELETVEAVKQYELTERIAKAQGGIVEAKKAGVKAARDAAKAEREALAEMEARSDVSRRMAGMFSTAGLRGRIDRNLEIARMTDDDILTVSAGDAAEVVRERQIAALISDIKMDLVTNEDVINKIKEDRANEHYARMKEGWQSFGQEFVDIGIGMYGTVAGAAQDYFDGLITGQEHAAEAMGIAIMRTAGDSLVASGIKLLGEGTVSLFTPGLQPLAAAQLGAGATLVASGMALGAGATAIEHTMAGGTIGRALPERDDRSGSDPGAAPARGRAGEGGALVVNVSYGVGGPLPEDVGRAVHEVIRETDRRRGAA